MDEQGGGKRQETGKDMGKGTLTTKGGKKVWRRRRKERGSEAGEGVIDHWARGSEGGGEAQRSEWIMNRV